MASNAPGWVDDAPPEGPEAVELAIRRAIVARLLRRPAWVRLIAGERETLRGRQVHPDYAALASLEKLARRIASGKPMTPTDERRQLALGSWTVDAEPPAGVYGEDLTLEGDDAPPTSIRLYTPQNVRSRPGPGLLYIHGGGWVVGSVASHDVLCRRLALGAGCPVASLRYRLAPEHPYPAAFDDARRGFQHVVAHADRLGMDPRRIAIGGDSAGGHLSALVANALRDEGPFLQLLIYPGVDLTKSFPSHRDFGRGYLLEDDKIDWYLEHFVPPDIARDRPDVSPWFEPDLSGVCPALVYTAGFDPLLDEGEAYARRLTEAGVEVTYRCFEDQIHGFANMAGAIDVARTAVDTITGDLRLALEGSSP